MTVEAWKVIPMAKDTVFRGLNHNPLSEWSEFTPACGFSRLSIRIRRDRFVNAILGCGTPQSVGYVSVTFRLFRPWLTQWIHPLGGFKKRLLSQFQACNAFECNLD
jgi:hypothetical protein